MKEARSFKGIEHISAAEKLISTMRREVTLKAEQRSSYYTPFLHLRGQAHSTLIPAPHTFYMTCAANNQAYSLAFTCFFSIAYLNLTKKESMLTVQRAQKASKNNSPQWTASGSGGIGYSEH